MLPASWRNSCLRSLPNLIFYYCLVFTQHRCPRCLTGMLIIYVALHILETHRNTNRLIPAKSLFGRQVLLFLLYSEKHPEFSFVYFQALNWGRRTSGAPLLELLPCLSDQGKMVSHFTQTLVSPISQLSSDRYEHQERKIKQA